MQFWPHLVTAAGAYLLGSIPTGFLVGKAKGVDVRSLGSGNIGATNVFRFLGKPAGSFVLFADALKGFLAVALIVNWYPDFRQWLPAMFTTGDTDNLLREQLGIVAGIFAVLGHNYTCWLQFKGGKGVSTSAGVLLAWVPLGLLAVFITWVIVFLMSKYVSLASIAAALVLPFSVWWLYADRPAVYVWITAGLSALAIYKHRPNIQRLLKGTEHRFGSKPDASTATP